MPVEVNAEDMQVSTNGIINDLLVKTMQQGAMIEALSRTLSETEQELSRLRAEKASMNGDGPAAEAPEQEEKAHAH